MQALRMFSSIARCLESAFTTGVPGGTCVPFSNPLITFQLHISTENTSFGYLQLSHPEYCLRCQDDLSVEAKRACDSHRIHD